MTKTFALALAGLVVAATPALAADSKEKQQAQKVAPAKNKAADKGSQGGIILQNSQKGSDKGAQGGIILQNSQKGADKGAKGGIILQNSQKGADKGAKGGIILQNNAGKSTNMKTPAGKSATPGG
jgi:ATPase subunit of ABC transporter with duplicated ATPase domains